MATNHEANVTLGGDASGAQAATKAAAKEIDAYDRQVAKAKFGTRQLSDGVRQAAASFNVQAEAAKKAELATFVVKARMENAAEAAKKLAASTTAVGKAAHGSRGGVQLLGSAVHNVAVGASTMLGAVNQVAAGLGPWGIAAAAAATIIGHFAMKQHEAAEAAKKATEEIRKQNRELERVRANEALGRLRADDETDQRARIRSLSGGAALDEERKALENMRAINRGQGRSTSAIESELVELKVKELEIEKAQLAVGADLFDTESKRKRRHEEAVIDAEIVNVRREEELRLLEETNKAEKKNHQARKEHLSELEQLVGKGADARFAQIVANHKGGDEAWRDFQKTQLGFGDAKTIDPFSGEDIERQKSEAAARAMGNRNQSMRNAATLPTAERIEVEKQALLEFNTFQQEQATTEAERIQLIDDRRAISHEAEMAQLAEKKKEHSEIAGFVASSAKEIAGHANAMIASSMSITKAKREATKAALLEGKTSAEAARVGKVAELEARAARMESIRGYMIQKGLEHAAEAIGAFARYDFVAGGLHLAAAAAFGAGAIIANARANTLDQKASNMQTGGFGGGMGRGGSGSTGGGGQKPRSGPSPIDSHIPGSPQAPSAGGSSGSSSGTTVVVNFHGDMYGAGGKKEFVRDLDEALAEVSHSRRRAS